VAEPGTVIGEFQRGWERFWRLSWWRKGPIIGFGAFILLGIVAAIAGGGEEDDSEPAVQATRTAAPTQTADTDSPTARQTSSPTPAQGPYSILEIISVTSDGDRVTISGSTDLPDGASISVTFEVWGRSLNDEYIGVDGGATVADGTFTITLTVPQRSEFVGGPYEVSLLFTPRGQSNDLIGLVGKDGEKLAGELVSESFGFNTLKLAERIDDLVVSVQPPLYTFQQPSDLPAGSAERVLAEYVLAWKNQDWARMAEVAQKTWLSDEPDPTGILAAWYDFKKLLGFEVTGVAALSNVTSDVTFIVRYEAFTNQVETKRITARVIRESAALTPSENGEWGVNPISALAEEDVE